MKQETQRGEFEREYLKKKIDWWKAIAIIMIGMVIAYAIYAIYVPAVKQQGATDILHQYASNGIAPIYITDQSTSNETVLTFININDYAQGWCQRVVEQNYVEICGEE